MKIFKPYNISHCTQKEIDKLNQFKANNPDKISPKVYYVTSGNMGYQLIATFDTPIENDDYIDFGKCIDITDYDERLLGF